MIQHTPSHATLAALLTQLGADIVCFQETKVSHADLWPLAFQKMAGVPGWDSYFCFTRQGSYSGVATYCRTAVTSVRAAEDGLLRVLPPQNPPCAAAQHTLQQSAAAAASAAWPQEIAFPEQELRSMFSAEEAVAVDMDGRCVITDHGLFVLFNVYLPACSGNNAPEQIVVKRNMARTLDVRLRALLAAGRHVVLAGDFNVAVPWWDNSMHQVRAPSISRSAASRAGAGLPFWQHQQQHQQQQQHHQQQHQLQQQQQQAHGQLSQADSAMDWPEGSSGVVSGSSAAVGDLVGTQSEQQQAADRLQQQQAADRLQQQQAQDSNPQGAEPLQAASRRDNLAPLAHYRRGQPVLPSSGAAEWLMRLTAPPPPPDDPNEEGTAAAAGASSQPTAGVLVDTLKALNPGVLLFSYPDAKKPGQVKLRPPNTAWSAFHGIRNDKNGARSDYIFTADATEYAAQLRKLQQHRHQQGLSAEEAQQPPLPPQHQQQQQPQQTVVQEAFSISLTSALSSAFILRELRWTDHAPVVLQLQLPPQAAQLLRSPVADPALQAVNPSAAAQHQTAAAPAAGSHPISPPSPGIAAAAAAGGAVGLPCLLSSWWLIHTEAAAAAASDILAAAGVQRAPPGILTCSILQQLRHSRYSAARQVIAARARQLYAPGSAATRGASSGDEQQPAPSSQRAAAGLPLSPSGGQQQGLGPQTPAGTTAVGSEHTAGGAQPPAPHTRQRQQQQQQIKKKGRRRHAKQQRAQQSVAAGSKRKGRGWAVVSMGDGRTATVACSSSDDSEG